MKPFHVPSLVEHAAENLSSLELLHAGMRRRGTPDDHRRGLEQVLMQTLRVCAERRLWTSRGDTEYNPTGLISEGGERLWVRSTYLPGHYDRHEFEQWSTDSQVPEWVGQGTSLPWDGGLPTWTTGGIRAQAFRHLTRDHPERWQSVGLTENQIRFRINPARQEMVDALNEDPALAEPYWYEPSPTVGRPCLVAPLTLAGPSSTLAAVLVPHDDHDFDLVTVLPLHEAFYNVVSVGRIPPLWLHGHRDHPDHRAVA